MKKILSLALVMMMVLSTFTMAFAGTFEDVKDDNDNSSAIEALAALNVFNGKPDGTFAPDGIVTRAEMAKLIVVAKNLGNIASGTANYTDVAADYWASGYIAVASQLGVINGRGNGIFDPTATVTYSEAVTMLLRAIGYTDANVNAIGDSYSAVAYLAKANELGLVPSGVNVNSGCTRQAVASMLFDTIKAKTVTTDENGNAVEGTKDLISALTNETTKDGMLVDLAAVRLNQKQNAVDLSSYLGQYVIAYTAKNTTEEVIFVKEEVNSSKSSTKVTVGASSLTIGASTTEYTLDTNVDVTVNGTTTENVGAASVAGMMPSGSNYDVVVTYDSAKKVQTITVDEYRTAHQMTESDLYAGAKDFTKQYYKLPLDDDDKFETSKVIVSGANSLEDIVKGNVVEVAYKGDYLYKVVVTKDMFTGKVEKQSGSANYINGKAYYLNNTSLKSIDLGDEGTFYLDRNGDLAFASTDTTINPTTSLYGVVIGTETGTIGDDDALASGKSITKAPKVGISKLDGTNVKYDFYVKLDGDNAKTDTVTGVTMSAGNTITATINIAGAHVDSTINGAEGTLVKYTLNSDGEIVSLEAATFNGYTGDIDPAGAVYAAMFNSNTKILAYDTTDNKFVSYVASDLPTGSSALAGKTVAENDAWAFIVLDAEITSTAVKNYAVVTKISNVILDGTSVKEVEAYVNGQKVTYVAAKNATVTALGDKATDLAKATKVFDIVLDADGRISKANLVTLPTADYATRYNLTSASAFAVNTNTIKVPGDYVLIGNDTRVYTVSSDEYVMSNTGDLARAYANLSGVETLVADFYDKDKDGIIDVIIFK